MTARAWPVASDRCPCGGTRSHALLSISVATSPVPVEECDTCGATTYRAALFEMLERAVGGVPWPAVPLADPLVVGEESP